MKQDHLSITELAKLRRVTAETLRYYDRIDLIKPDYVDPGSNYRYYSIRQYEKLGTVRELRQLGLSVKEVQAYFDDRNVEKSTRILAQHYRRLQQEIQEKMLLSKALARKLAFLRELDPPPACDTVFPCHFPARRIITFGKPAGGPREHAFAFTELELLLEDQAPILASDRIGVYCGPELLEPSSACIPCVPMIFVEEGEACPDYVRTIPEGDYVCMYYRGSGLEEYNPAFRQVQNYLEACGLEVAGDVLQIYKIDVTITSREEETLMQLQVPVKPR